MHGSGRAGAPVELAYYATREILRSSDSAAVRTTLAELCRALGADVVPADSDRPDTLPIDLSLGEADPVVPASGDPLVREDILRFVVPAVADARLALDRDVTNSRMTHMATRDPLTGLWNRHSIDLAVDRARQGDSLAMLDLDHFKLVNDDHGHAEGDAILRAFAACLRDGVREEDIVGRHGGEEFVVIFPRASLSDSRAALDRIRQSWLDSAPRRITFSAGLACVEASPDGIPTAGQAAMRWADAALYQAKADGRDCIVSASP